MMSTSNRGNKLGESEPVRTGKGAEGEEAKKREWASQQPPLVLDLPPKVREYYEALRDQVLQTFDDNEAPKVILVTSSYAGEGVSTVAANLAVTLSRQARVLLLDANLNKPRLHRVFYIDLRPGFAQALHGPHSPPVPAAHNLGVLTAGKKNGKVVGIDDSRQNLARLLDHYKPYGDFLVVDSPSINESSAALRLAGLADGVVLVIEAERTRWEAAQSVKKKLNQAGARILGVVLNKRRFHVPKVFYGD